MSLSLNFIRLLQVVITPSVMSLLRGENDSKQSDEFQATCPPPYKTIIPTVFPLTN